MPDSLPYPGLDMQIVREHAARRVRYSSLRAVASEVPIRHTTLFTFLQGREPGRRVRANLCEWYYRETDDGRDAELAIDLLCRFMLPEQQDHFRRALLDRMEGGFRTGGRDVPPWIDRLRG